MLPFVCFMCGCCCSMLPFVAVLYYYCTSCVVCLLLCSCCCRYVAVFADFFWYVFCRLSVAVRLLLQVCCRCCCIVAVRLLPFVCCYIRTSFLYVYCFMFGVERLYQHGCNYYLSSVFLYNVRIFCHSLAICFSGCASPHSPSKMCSKPY